VKHPERLGKYQVLEVLGEGAMGVVYKGFDPDIRRTVALKTIHRQFDDDSEFAASMAARFRNEAQAAGRLSHPGIVAVYDYGEDNRVAFIAMEYVEGHSLAHYVGSRVRFTDADIPGVMSQLLEALQHAHDQGVWHRDIKPANIIMAPGGRLKVADFGIARIDNGGLTQANTMIGTPAYMAPEQFLGQPIDQRVDLYSAGVLLYLLLTGRPPFSGPQDALMYKVVHEAPVPPTQIEGVERPRFYDAIVARALAKTPEQRYANAAAFKQALLDAIGEPVDDTAWDRTIVAAPLPPKRTAVPVAPVERSGAQTSMTSLAPDGWDRTLLAQAEAALARHVGPLAGVLVRRAARECSDLPTLYAKLAEQVTNAAARSAFLGEATASGVLANRTGTLPANVSSASASAATAVGATTVGGGALSDALVDQATRALAQHIGPIAKIVVKKAAARATQREPFFALLGESVTDAAARARLLGDLARLA
jgi:serine/threonine protein kinase